MAAEESQKAAAEVEEGFVDISEEKDGSLLKKVLVEGEGDESPPKGSDVWVHYVGTLHEDGSKFDSSRDRGAHFEFQVGTGQVIKAWDIGICTMKKGEKCILRAAHNYAYGEHGSPPKIPPSATLNFEVELFRWKEREPEPYSMESNEERSAYALQQKEAGNAAVSAKDWETAVDRYASGINFVDFNAGGGHGGGGGHGHSHGGEPCTSGHGDDDDEMGSQELGEKDKKLLVALLSNSAMAHLKLDDPDTAATECTRALDVGGESVKVLFRRAQARVALKEFAGATEDCCRILAAEPDNAQAQQLKIKASTEEKREKQKEKAMYGKMFG